MTLEVSNTAYSLHVPVQIYIPVDCERQNVTAFLGWGHCNVEEKFEIDLSHWFIDEHCVFTILSCS